MTTNTNISPLFILGLQKSGTTLLNRLLAEQPGVIDPFKPEGRYFWGDDPPFSPGLPPCGTLYQAEDGGQGHFLSDTDFREKDQVLLHQRMAEITSPHQLLINKNPYNTVRVKWLKSIFPNCRIVAIIRNPVSNIFSLSKKFIDHENMGLPPEKGWWGVKPRNWQDMVKDDLIEQLSDQWFYVNTELLENIDLLNGLIDYQYLCNNTSQALKSLLTPYQITACSKEYRIEHQDSEFQTGSRLLSKNKEYNKTGFQIQLANEQVEIPPFTTNQISQINHKCQALWNDIKSKVF